MRVCVQVIHEGKAAQDQAAQLLGYFRQDYPIIVRAVKTRDTARTVLMHKSRFVSSLAKAGLLEEKESNTLEVRYCKGIRTFCAGGIAACLCSAAPTCNSSSVTRARL